MNQSIRAFIAIELPPLVQEALGSLLAGLKSRRPRGVRWVEAKGIHLTLKFLGNISNLQKEDVIRAMASVTRDARPFVLELTQTGAFPSIKNPRVLWVGVGGRLQPLMTIQSNLEKALSSVNFSAEVRPFSPHLTLGRVKEGLAKAEGAQIGEEVSRASLPPGLSFEVKELGLIQSILAPEGSIYRVLAVAPIGRG